MEQNTITDTVKDIKYAYFTNDIITENDQEAIPDLQILEKIKSEFNLNQIYGTNESDNNKVIKFGDDTRWTLGYDLFIIITCPVQLSQIKFVRFYQNLINKGSPWMIIHTLANIIKGAQHVNIETEMKNTQNNAFLVPANAMYEHPVSYTHLTLPTKA